MLTHVMTYVVANPIATAAVLPMFAFVPLVAVLMAVTLLDRNQVS